MPRSELVVRGRVELPTFRFSGRKTPRRVRLWPESSLAEIRRLWGQTGPLAPPPRRPGLRSRYSRASAGRLARKQEARAA
jgi:hypothetical protein